MADARDTGPGAGPVSCAKDSAAGAEATVVRTTLAGVPAILRVPRIATESPIVLWHGYGPPASEDAMMQALPLDDVPAVKVYLGLPLFGARALPGGVRELVHRQQQDFGLLIFEPTVVGAADELPLVVDALKRRGCMKPEMKIALVGFSAGGAAVLYAMSKRKIPIGKVALINPSTGLTASIRAMERATGRPYAWSPESRRLADRTDAIRHAAEISSGTPIPAILILQGDEDSVIGSEGVTGLYDTLLPYFRKAHAEQRLKLERPAGMSHDWVADENASSSVRRSLSDWFRGP